MNLFFKGYYQFMPSHSDLSFGKAKLVFAPLAEVFFNPYGKPGSRIFGRTSYIGMEGQDPFWKFQIGYSISFSELINGKIED
jgi:hypothetical protein